MSQPANRFPRSFMGSAAILALFSLALIVFGSPLFRGLGFEYSALSSLALSLVIGFYAANEVGQRSHSEASCPVASLLWPSMLLISIPLIVSLLSLLFLSNCALWDGVMFYFKVAVPGGILALLFGAACGMAPRKKFWRSALFFCFWLVTFVLSLLPGYLNPQVFSYGWQYGFFPGLVWDDALELGGSYYLFRIENLILALLVLNAIRSLYPNSHEELSSRRWFSLALLIVVFGATVFFGDDVRITSSHARAEAYLSRDFKDIPGVELHYKPGNLSADELTHLSSNIKWYLHDISEKLGLGPERETIQIYLYPSSEAMFEYVGTRTASISKPWLHELHLTKENLGSLKHELTHVMLADIGSWPFDISWSTGITEGVAMAMEPRYDGLHTLDEDAARILQLHLAAGVQGVMSFSGFASNASQKSYVLAGSFARFLLTRFGAAPYRNVYRSLDFEAEYHRTLPQLEQEWLASLAPLETPMDYYDSLRTRYYYERSSIILTPCFRRIGKLNRAASEANRAYDFARADSIYALILDESKSPSALSGRLHALIALKRYDAAQAVLDTTTGLDPIKGRAGLMLIRGDLAYLRGDTGRAFGAYEEAGRYLLSDSHALEAARSDQLFRTPLAESSSDRLGWRDYLAATYGGIFSPDALSLLGRIGGRAAFGESGAAAYNYLLGMNLARKGALKDAVGYLRLASQFRPFTRGDSIIRFEAGLVVSAYRDTTIDLQLPSFMARAAASEVAEIRAKRAYFHQQGWKFGF